MNALLPEHLKIVFDFLKPTEKLKLAITGENYSCEVSKKMVEKIRKKTLRILCANSFASIFNFKHESILFDDKTEMKEEMNRVSNYVQEERVKNLVEMYCNWISKIIIKKYNYDWKQEIVRMANDPIFDKGSIAVLKGNLAPGSAIIKQSAASANLLTHEGVVEVFENLEDLANRIDSEDLNVTKDSILLLRNIGPIGAPGMPEAGLIPIPKKLARQGVKDMVRISDGRMSGTAAGTIILHICPEAAAGGTLGIVQSGDIIKLDVKNRLLELKLSDEEINKRKKNKKINTDPKRRGYNTIFHESVLQADKGADFDFLRPLK